MVRHPNPAWVDTALTKAWPELQQSIAPPIVTTKGKRHHAEELGCGHYGCVLATSRPDVVLKITSDPTEAAFVTLLMRHKLEQDGLVRYFEVRKLPGERRGRELFAIWREAAYDVGTVTSRHSWEPVAAEKRQLVYRLNRFKMWAHEIRNVLKRQGNPWPLLKEAQAPDMYKRAGDFVEIGRGDMYAGVSGQVGPDSEWEPVSGRGAPIHDAVLITRWPIREPSLKLAVLLRACEMTAQFLGSEPAGYLIGGALENLLDEGILLADVHGMNIGRVDRPDHNGAVVITDPGHAVFLRQGMAEEAVAIAGAAAGSGSKPKRLMNPAGDEAIDPSAMTGDELRAALRGAGQQVGGSRADLEARLRRILDVRGRYGDLPEEDLQRMTVPELKGVLRKMDRALWGTKAQLVARARQATSSPITPRAPTKRATDSVLISWQNPITGRREIVGEQRSMTLARDWMARQQNSSIVGTLGDEVEYAQRAGFDVYDLDMQIEGTSASLPTAPDRDLEILHEIQRASRGAMGPAFAMATTSTRPGATRQLGEISHELGRLRDEMAQRRKRMLAEPEPGRHANPTYRALPLAQVIRWRQEAARRGVSEVARGPGGFLPAYEAAGGNLERMSPWWRARRQAFLARHLAQVAAHHERLFESDGAPTRRHLALVMWAYSPTPARLARMER
jgi:hypothetical protein